MNGPARRQKSALTRPGKRVRPRAFPSATVKPWLVTSVRTGGAHEAAP
jgi:hypothetical protein